MIILSDINIFTFIDLCRAVIMNRQSHLIRWNRFRLAKAKDQIRNCSELKTNRISDQRGKENCHALESLRGGLTPKSEIGRTKQKQILTSRHQNREQSSKDSTSLSTKHQFPQNQSKIPHPHSRSRPQKGNSISPSKFLSSYLKIQTNHKINYSILQRIHKTLQLYPNIAHEFKSPTSKSPNFATQSSDECGQFCEKQIINLSKLVLWRQSKLLKTTQRIYEYLMEIEIKQDQKLKGSKTGRNQPTITLKREVKHYLMQKYKTEKLCKENFINLCYSLYYYIDKTIYEKSIRDESHLRMKLRMLLIFERFLILEYNQDDLIFYLYSRNIFSSILRKESRHAQANFVSSQQIKQFLSILSNGDSCILRYYQTYLMRTLQDEREFEVHEILYHLLSNFQAKKTHTSFHARSIKRLETRSLNINEMSEKNEELSVSMVPVDYDRQFWNTDPPLDEDINENLYEKLLEEIGRQTKKLMSYFQQQYSNHRETASQLVLIKAIRMLNIVHKMDKYKWFEEIHLVKEKVLIAKSEDFSQIDALHSELREIVHNHEDNRLERKKVVEFSKKLLTTRVFVDKLEELFESFDNSLQVQ